MSNTQRWLTVAGMIVAAFAGGAFMQWLAAGNSMAEAAATAQGAAKESRAQAFVLVDATGAEVARLGVVPGPNGPLRGLRVLGPSGKATLLAGSSETGAGIGIYDHEGKANIGLGVGRDGATGGMAINRASGKVAVGMGYGPDAVGMHVHDTDGRERAVLGVGPDGTGSFVVSDGDGAVTWRAP